MKTYIVSFNGAIDVEADNEDEAREIFMRLSDEEIGRAIEEYDEITEIG